MKTDLDDYLFNNGLNLLVLELRVTNVTPLMAYKHHTSKRMILERGRNHNFKL